MSWQVYKKISGRAMLPPHVTLSESGVITLSTALVDSMGGTTWKWAALMLDRESKRLAFKFCREEDEVEHSVCLSIDKRGTGKFRAPGYQSQFGMNVTGKMRFSASWDLSKRMVIVDLTDMLNKGRSRKTKAKKMENPEALLGMEGTS